MEIIVGMLLFGMVVLTVTATISPLTMAYRRANDLAEYNQILDTIGNRITSDMAKARQNGITHGENTLTITTNSGTITYTIDTGRLQRNGSQVYQQEFYRGKQIAFTVDGTSSPSFNLNLIVSTPNATGTHTGSTITRTYTVRPLLMS